jgi:hypothetical protein
MEKELVALPLLNFKIEITALKPLNSLTVPYTKVGTLYWISPCQSKGLWKPKSMNRLTNISRIKKFKKWTKKTKQKLKFSPNSKKWRNKFRIKKLMSKKRQK